MSSNDPLAELRDIRLPDPISWWPLAPGWWILIGVFLIITLVVASYFYRRAKKRRVIKQVQKKLATIAQQQPNREALITSLQLFRRAHLNYQSNRDVASVPLNQLAQKISQQFNLPISNTSLELLSDLQYRPELNISQTDWQQLMLDLGRLVSKLDQPKRKTRSTAHA